MSLTRRQFLKHLSFSLMALPVLGYGRKRVSGRPNIIFIMIDDLGYGDIGCYGSETNQTPNIDRLAQEGMMLTDYHTNGPMCSPTRAAFLTGKYQHRFGKKFEGALSGTSDYNDGLPLDAYTIAEALRNAGYATGMYGKWHLGYQPPFLPNRQGFDEFIGLVAGDGDHHTHIDRWGRKDWWHNARLNMEKGYSEDLITGHSIEFIEAHRNTPFFLYVSHLSIHFPWQGPDDPPHREAGKVYTDDKWGIIPNPDDVSPHVQAMIEAVDEGVGRIIETLRHLGLAENTLVIFTSDNGGYRHYGDTHFNISDNGPLRGQKTEVYEGGHRVPFIAWWPGTIEPGSVSDELVMTMDMYPTFLELAGSERPSDLQLDGTSIASHLLERARIPDRAVCWKIGDHRAVRQGQWKLCLIGDNNPELYNVSDDIGETVNLVGENLELVRRLTAAYTEWENAVTANYDSE
ncbi:MAG TPA: sulfatase [bacterium]|nr:sulfatase [bacterium]